MLVEHLTLLLIDDSPDDREFYRYWLDQDPHHTYTFLEAETGEEGLVLSRQHDVDGILLDYRLPNLDGLEVLDILVKEKGAQACAIIMLTGSSEAVAAGEVLEHGAQVCLDKDRLTADSFCREVVQAITRYRQQRGLKR